MTVRVLEGDCRDVLKTLPDESVHCVVTSPPYWGLRDYGVVGQLGLEETPVEYIAGMVEVFREIRRVLRSDGTAWVNMGDSYATVGGASTPQMGEAFKDRQRGQEVVCRSKRMGRGAGRWGGGNNPAAGLLKPKDLCGTPWRLAFALQDDGWWLRQDIIWAKPNPMPESVRDRCTKAHEYIFLLAKSERYYFDAEAIKEPASENSHGSPNVNPGWKQEATGNNQGGTLGQWPPRTKGKHSAMPKQSSGHRMVENVARAREEGADHDNPFGLTRNKRSVWTITTQPFKDAHFAVFPPDLILPCILAGCPAGGTVLDPFGGAGTTALVADRLQRDAILIELNPEYAEIARRRITNDSPLFAEVS
jgi:DNA modification methylase